MIQGPVFRSQALAAAILVLGLAAACSERKAEAPAASEPPAAAEPSPPPASAPPPAPNPASPNAAESAMPSGEGSADLDRSPLGVFEGTLPCADCEGIRTELTLFLQPDTFVLRESRLGGQGDGVTITSEGPWQAALGTEEDPDATVIQLDPEKPDTMRSFREVGGDRLELLDRSGRRIESKQDHSLKRKVEQKEGS